MKFLSVHLNKFFWGGILISLLGCITVTEHQNFINFLKYAVGTNVNSKVYYEFGWKGNLVQATPLTNGNLLNQYIYKNTHGTCIYNFEVDSAGKIVDWKIVSGEEACVVEP